MQILDCILSESTGLMWTLISSEFNKDMALARQDKIIVMPQK